METIKMILSSELVWTGIIGVVGWLLTKLAGFLVVKFPALKQDKVNLWVNRGIALVQEWKTSYFQKNQKKPDPDMTRAKAHEVAESITKNNKSVNISGADLITARREQKMGLRPTVNLGGNFGGKDNWGVNTNISIPF